MRDLNFENNNNKLGDNWKNRFYGSLYKFPNIQFKTKFPNEKTE